MSWTNRLSLDQFHISHCQQLGTYSLASLLHTVMLQATALQFVDN